jgi:TRAP-type mannitol/chloroaromatic compound transport system substrate-binding protein
MRLARLAVIAMFLAAPAQAEPRLTTIDVASTFPGKMPVLGEAAHRLADKVSRASGGELSLKFHEPGQRVPAADTV